MYVYWKTVTGRGEKTVDNSEIYLFLLFSDSPVIFFFWFVHVINRYWSKKSLLQYYLGSYFINYHFIIWNRRSSQNVTTKKMWKSFQLNIKVKFNFKYVFYNLTEIIKRLDANANIRGLHPLPVIS